MLQYKLTLLIKRIKKERKKKSNLVLEINGARNVEQLLIYLPSTILNITCGKFL